MTPLVSHLSALLLGCLSVRQARRYVSQVSRPVHALVPVVQASSITSQLLVDVSVIYQHDARTGIQRVVRALLLQLTQCPPSGYAVRPVFATRSHGYRYAPVDFLTKRVAVTSDTSLVQAQSQDIFLGLDLAAHLLPRHSGQILNWKRMGVKVHLLVYDLLPLQHPEWFHAKTTRNFMRWIKWLAVYADSAVCISESVKLELHTWLMVNFDLQPVSLPTSTIALGADIDVSAPSGGLPDSATYCLSRLYDTPAVLMVGTVEPRKSYDQALAAFEQLWDQQGVTSVLVIVGRPGWKTEALQEKMRSHPQAGKRFFWLEDVSDEYLKLLYAACAGVLIASKAEGFGLPLIEAALHNKSVLARDLPVFREIDLPNITFFSGEDAISLATAILAWQRNSYHEPSHKNTVNESQGVPTWGATAKQLLHSLGVSCDIYREVFAERPASLLAQRVAT